MSFDEIFDLTGGVFFFIFSTSTRKVLPRGERVHGMPVGVCWVMSFLSVIRYVKYTEKLCKRVRGGATI